MTYFTYDGTFEGLLTAVFEVYERKAEKARIISDKTFQPDMFGEEVRVCTDATKANRVWKGLQKKLPVASLVNVYSVYLSELPEMEEVLLHFFREVFASDENIEENYGSHAVLRVAQIGRQLFREKHRFEAFVRFQKLQDGTFYAAIDPDFNVLPLITAHFVRRYADQEWIIYDTRRQYGIHYDKKQVQEVHFEFELLNSYGQAPEETYDQQEDLYQLLWKVYFKNVNIPARRNIKLHKRNMPVRYWKYLVEKQPGFQ
jgi:probable DNA metabolism protein